MDEGRFHCKVLLAAIVEILSQVGFERASKQSLQVIIDLTLGQINQRLLSVKKALSETGLAEAYNEGNPEKNSMDPALVNTILHLIVEESTGSEESYRREELVSFLQYQLNITKQIKKETSPQEESLLEILRVGDQIKPIHNEDRGIIDFTGEEEGEKKAPEEKKYLDQDVQDHLKERANIPERKKDVHKIEKIEKMLEDVELEESFVRINPVKKDYLIRNNMRDYEYMLNKKRLSMYHCTPCETEAEIPFLEDILSLSTLRKLSKKQKTHETKEKEIIDEKVTI